MADDLSAGRPERLDDQVVLHKVGMGDAASLGAVVAQTRPELICHLAAQIDVRLSVDSPAHDTEINVLGTVNVLEAARTVDARVLFASSGGAISGRDAPIPSPEPYSTVRKSQKGGGGLCCSPPGMRASAATSRSGTLRTLAR